MILLHVYLDPFALSQNYFKANPRYNIILSIKIWVCCFKRKILNTSPRYNYYTFKKILNSITCPRQCLNFQLSHKCYEFFFPNSVSCWDPNNVHTQEMVAMFLKYLLIIGFFPSILFITFAIYLLKKPGRLFWIVSNSDDFAYCIMWLTSSCVLCIFSNL